jgi:hypothetical protein
VNNGKFVNAFDDRYFKANPYEIIASYAVWLHVAIP